MNEKEPTPEQLLKMLDLQMQNARAGREKRTESRTSFRVIAIVVVLFLLMASLWVLMMVAEEVRPKKPQKPDAPAAQPVPAQTR